MSVVTCSLSALRHVRLVLKTKNVDPRYGTYPELKPITRNVFRGINLDHTVKSYLPRNFPH